MFDKLFLSRSLRLSSLLYSASLEQYAIESQVTAVLMFTVLLLDVAFTLLQIWTVITFFMPAMFLVGLLGPMRVFRGAVKIKHEKNLGKIPNQELRQQVYPDLGPPLTSALSAQTLTPPPNLLT